MSFDFSVVTEGANGRSVKTFANTYLYNKYPAYEKNILEFIMKGTQISVVDEAFEDIYTDVKKRQISSALLKVLQSKNVILMYDTKPLSKQFKVLYCKDIKNDGKPRTFIDCSDIITKENGVYKCRDVDMLIAYLADAMIITIYNVVPEKLLTASVVKSGCQCFTLLFVHILDYLHKISTIPATKSKSIYLCAMYYLVCLAGKDKDEESTRYIARKLADISEREEEIIRMSIEDNAYLNIKFFVEALAHVLKLDKLTVDIIAEKWMYLFGISTVFSLELFPSFCSMIIDAYVGCFINNQKTIEKIAGREMVTFTKLLLDVGGTAV